MDSFFFKEYSIKLSKNFPTSSTGPQIDQDLVAIKQYLTEPPILASPETGETLYLYIVVSNGSISTTLFKEDEHQKQRPMFFISPCPRQKPDIPVLNRQD